MEWGSAVLWYKVGAAGGSAHGGASPLLSPQGPVPSGLAPFFSRVDDYIAPRSLFVVSRFFEDRSPFLRFHFPPRLSPVCSLE